MSELQSARLAQFWHHRLRILSEPLPAWRIRGPEVYEAIGWLIEGVFCGYFDAREADIVWIRLQPILKLCVEPPKPPLITETLADDIQKLQRSVDPFRQTSQMTAGPQREYELRLFAHALLIADRFFADRPANICVYCLRSLPDTKWARAKESWPTVDPTATNRRLADPTIASIDNPSLLAGYLRLLEHMQASRGFFDYAKTRASKAVDFESYCRRVGGLNAWRIPLVDFGRSRFEQLSELFESAVTAEQGTKVWKSIASPVKHHITRLVEAWEEHHLTESFVGA